MMNNDKGFTFTEILVALAVGGVLMFLAYTFILRSLTFEEIFKRRLDHVSEERSLNLIFTRHYASEIKLNSAQNIIVRYNLVEADTIEILNGHSIRKNGNTIKLVALKPLDFQLIQGKNFRVRLLCKGRSYEWYIIRSGSTT